MKKVLLIMLCLLLITGCTKKIEDNPNTPFIEIDRESQKKFGNAFKTKEINRIQKSYEDNYKLDKRKDMTTNWQENNTISNVDDYHFWFTCYYKTDDIEVIHVERSKKGYKSVKHMLYWIEYRISNYSFSVWGRSLNNFTYILVLKNDNLYELDYAYENNIINDDDVKEIYKHYIDSKFLKCDPEYNRYHYEPDNIPEY